MDRAILLALLGAPVLMVIYIAMFRQPMPSSGTMLWPAMQGAERARPQGNWPSPKQAAVPRFVVERTAQQGS